MGLRVVAWLIMVCSLAPFLAGAQEPADLPELGGVHPVATPVYEGVDQILVLSDRCVVAVTSTVEEVVEEVDALSNGQLRKAADAWERSQDGGRRPDWNAKRAADRLREQYIAQARENAGERDLKALGSYAISSVDDPNYESSRTPERIGYTLVGLGAGRLAGAPEVDYAHYAYLLFPEPMQRGRTYTITVRGTKRAIFLFDEDQTVSRAIKVNQMGYLPDAPRKYAYLGAHVYGVGPLDCSMYSRFDVVNAADGSVALSGEIRIRDKNSRIVSDRRRTRGGGGPGGEAPPLINGEDVYEIDLTPLTDTGDFYIRIPGVGRSWPFRHGPDAYGPVFYTAARGLYHQRCGIPYEAPYTAWRRARCHTAPVYECAHISFGFGEFGKPKNYNVFDVIGGSIDRTKQTEDVWGGWHDAADWDRRNLHYTAVFDLLYAYEIAPEKFGDGQLHVPESGNGVPDVLDEAAFGLEVWAKSMTPEGGVSGYVETYGHPRMDQDIDYAFARRTRWDSLLFAAGAAQLAQHLKPYDAAAGERWAGLALKAYAYGNDPANSLGRVEIPARQRRGQGAPYTIAWEEKDEYVAPYLLHARVRLYRLTGDKAYLDGLARDTHTTPQPYKWPFTMMDYSPWLYFGMLHGPESYLPEFQQKKLLHDYFIEPADKLVAYLDDIPYRRTWPRNQAGFMGFGNTDMTNPGRVLLIAHALTGDSKYREAAILNFDFMLGANPMGMSWTTGLGYAYPVDIQHEVSAVDGIADPVPGITIYGVTGGMYRALKETVWQSPGGAASASPVVFDLPDVPLWRRWSCHPSLNVGQCEFTVQETMSSTIFCSALLMPDGWQPSAPLMARGPRPANRLYGHWYLP